MRKCGTGGGCYHPNRETPEVRRPTSWVSCPMDEPCARGGWRSEIFVLVEPAVFLGTGEAVCSFVRDGPICNNSETGNRTNLGSSASSVCMAHSCQVLRADPKILAAKPLSNEGDVGVDVGARHCSKAARCRVDAPVRTESLGVSETSSIRHYPRQKAVLVVGSFENREVRSRTSRGFSIARREEKAETNRRRHGRPVRPA